MSHVEVGFIELEKFPYLHIVHSGELTIEALDCYRKYPFTRNVDFDNGCSISLDGIDLWEGSCPYGTFWGVDAGVQSFQKIIDWVNYWNEDRDEYGNKICGFR